MGKKKRRAARAITQSGVIPILYDWPDVHAVLITPRGPRGRARAAEGEDAAPRWIVPKGNIPKTLSPEDAAAREAFEEAGITGRVLPEPVGRYRYRKGGVRHDVALYVLRVSMVHAEWPEMGERRRSIVGLARAGRLVASKALRRALRRARVVASGLDRPSS